MERSTYKIVSEVNVEETEAEVENSVLDGGQTVPEGEILEEVGAGGGGQVGRCQVAQKVAKDPENRQDQPEQTSLLISRLPKSRGQIPG